MKTINRKARNTAPTVRRRGDREENLFILSGLSALSGSKGINA